VTTFARWLTEQAERGQQDPIGWLARAWGSIEPDHRARISSPTKIKKVLSEQGSQTAEWQQYMASAVEAAVTAYRERPDGPAAAQQLPPAGDEPAAAELSGEGTVTADGPVVADGAAAVAMLGQNWEGWATEPQERLGTCLACGALMGVGMVGGQKVLVCAAGHPVSKRVAQQLIAAADKQLAPDEAFDAAIERGDEHLPAPSDPETVDHGEVARSIMGRQHQLDRIEAALAGPSSLDDRLAWIGTTLGEVRAQQEAQETMLGLLAQMLAAASPAAAQVLTEFVQDEGDHEAQHAAGGVSEADFEADQRWHRLPEQEMPPSFQAYYGMAPGRPESGGDDG
jgi:hypothetical protein